MLLQLAIGTVLLVVSVLFAAAMSYLLRRVLSLAGGWLARHPHQPKLAFALSSVVLWTLAMMTGVVWLWALAYYWLGAFSTLEASVYFSLVSFTTLGYGDELLPHRWRILGGLEAADGLLLTGLATAVLVELLRNIRQAQLTFMGGRGGS